MPPKAAPKAKAAATNGGGIKKGGRKPKNQNAKNAMIKMQAFFKEHRSQFSTMTFKDQQKELGKLWKASPENPKNQS